MKKILPTLLATITGKPRYLPEIRWSKNSWVHNIFRVYELVFWRRYGMRTERYVYEKTITDSRGLRRNIFVNESHTLEAFCAQLEVSVRSFLSKLLKGELDFSLPFYFRLEKTELLTVGSYKVPQSAYVFAIAFDAVTAVTATNGVSSKTQAHTTSGSDRIVVPIVGCGASTVSTVTYNAVSCTRDVQVNLQTSWAELWNLVAPATGANNIVVTCAGSTSITIGSVSFTGASQTGQPDAFHADTSQTAGVTSYSHALTTVASDCMIVMAGRANGGAALTGGANTTVLQPEVAAMGMFGARTTATVSPGSNSLAMTSSSQQFFSVVASYKPVAPPNPVFTRSIFARLAVTRSSNY